MASQGVALRTVVHLLARAKLAAGDDDAAVEHAGGDATAL
jgi:hypothetical protein